MSLEQLHATAEAALGAASGLAWRHGGVVDDARQLTTVCLAVVLGDALVLGVTTARANAATPDLAFGDLGRWDVGSELANVAPARVWASRTSADRARFELEAPDAGGTTPEQLLRAVLQAPDDDAPRLVYADALLEQGDPRGALIAAQLGPEDEGLVTALLEEHQARWVPETSRGLAVRFARGFVEAVRCPDVAAGLSLGPLFEREPVRRVALAHTRSLDVAALTAPDWLERLTGLELGNRPVAAEFGLRPVDLERLLTSRRFRNLRSLTLQSQRLGDEGARVLARVGPSALPRLEALSVRHAGLGDAGLQVLVGTRWFRGLAAIDLSDNALGTEDAAHFAHGTWPRLHTLALDGNRLRSEGALRLAVASGLSQLEALSLARNRLTAAGVEALLEATALPSLRRLEVSGNALSETLLARVARRAAREEAG